MATGELTTTQEKALELLRARKVAQLGGTQPRHRWDDVVTIPYGTARVLVRLGYARELGAHRIELAEED